jgi:hypothetical protein
MDLTMPFTGTLITPDKLLPHGDSPVTLPDGTLVAQIRWNVLATGSFTVLDAEGQELATGRPPGLVGRTGRRHEVHSTDGSVLLELTLGWRGAAGRSTVSLPDGRRLTVKGATFRRRFWLLDAGELEVGAITPTSTTFSMRKQSYAFDLRAPVLSAVQAVALAQALREAVKSGNRAYPSTVGTSR